MVLAGLVLRDAWCEEVRRDDFRALVQDFGTGFPFFSGNEKVSYFYFFTLVTGPRRPLMLKLSDTRVY